MTLRTSFPSRHYVQSNFSGHAPHEFNRRPETQLAAVEQSIQTVAKDLRAALRKDQAERAARLDALLDRQLCKREFFLALVEHKGQALSCSSRGAG